MKIAITGASGFLGMNLRFRLEEAGYTNLILIPHDSNQEQMMGLLSDVDFVYHLAGVNRPRNNEDFQSGNLEFTQKLIKALEIQEGPSSLVYSSSTQAELSNLYGESKRAAEKLLIEFQKRSKVKVFIFRLTNVFGKWCRPNYNSVVATFCHKISQSLPVSINDRTAPLKLVYIDDVISSFISLLKGKEEDTFQSISPLYKTTVGELFDQVSLFHEKRKNAQIENAGTGFTRALYATYLSYIRPSEFTCDLVGHEYEGRKLVDMIKTPDSGDFSYYKAQPGEARGGCYHHSKSEKFLVIKGTASFTFRNMRTDEYYELTVQEKPGKIVEMIPGWAHDITNVGDDELVVIFWASEPLDINNTDTFQAEISL